MERTNEVDQPANDYYESYKWKCLAHNLYTMSIFLVVMYERIFCHQWNDFSSGHMFDHGPKLFLLLEALLDFAVFVRSLVSNTSLESAREGLVSFVLGSKVPGTSFLFDREYVLPLLSGSPA